MISIGFHNKDKLFFLLRKVNAQICKKMLEEQKPSFRKLSQENPIFQQDNESPIHQYENCSKFQMNIIQKLQWPALSPDLKHYRKRLRNVVEESIRGSKQNSIIKKLKRALDCIEQHISDSN